MRQVTHIFVFLALLQASIYDSSVRTTSCLGQDDDIREVVFRSPVHVHVFKAEGEIIINLDDLSVRDAWRMKRRDGRQALNIVEQHQAFLLAEWERIHG